MHGVAYSAQLITAWNKVLLENLTVAQLVHKLPAFYGNQRFMAVYTTSLLDTNVSQLNAVC